MLYLLAVFLLSLNIAFSDFAQSILNLAYTQNDFPVEHGASIFLLVSVAVSLPLLFSYLLIKEKDKISGALLATSILFFVTGGAIGNLSGSTYQITENNYLLISSFMGLLSLSLITMNHFSSKNNNLKSKAINYAAIVFISTVSAMALSYFIDPLTIMDKESLIISSDITKSTMESVFVPIALLTLLAYITGLKFNEK